jgi:flagellar FliJ protein
MAVDLKSLRTVIDMATTRRDHAGAALAHARQQLAQGQAQLKQLADYVDEGEGKWMQRAVQGVTVVLMQHQRQFMDKIQAAIDFQHNVLTQRQAQVDRALQALQAAELTLAKIKKIEHTTLTEKALNANKIEKKLNDEMAMTMLAHQRRENHAETRP